MAENLSLTNSVSGVLTTALATTTTTEVIAAQGANLAVHITGCTITNAHATQGCRVDILNGSTVKWTGQCGALGGGYAVNFSSPLLGAVNTAWSVKCDTAGASVYAALSGTKSTMVA